MNPPLIKERTLVDEVNTVLFKSCHIVIDWLKEALVNNKKMGLCLYMHCYNVKHVGHEASEFGSKLILNILIRYCV